MKPQSSLKNSRVKALAERVVEGHPAADPPAFLGLMKTCMKLGESFYANLGDRITHAGKLRQLPDLVR